MKESKDIAKISMEVDPAQLRKIVSSGNLEKFVQRATQIFARDLKTQLVEESVSSISTNLVLWDDDEYGTGPRPPIWHMLESLEILSSKVQMLERGIVSEVGGIIG